MDPVIIVRIPEHYDDNRHTSLDLKPLCKIHPAILANVMGGSMDNLFLERWCQIYKIIRISSNPDN